MRSGQSTKSSAEGNALATLDIDRSLPERLTDTLAIDNCGGRHVAPIKLADNLPAGGNRLVLPKKDHLAYDSGPLESHRRDDRRDGVPGLAP